MTMSLSICMVVNVYATTTGGVPKMSAYVLDKEDIDTMVQRIRNALRFVTPDRLILAPDCGMKYLPRPKAFAKLSVLAEAARKVRAEL